MVIYWLAQFLLVTVKLRHRVVISSVPCYKYLTFIILSIIIIKYIFVLRQGGKCHTVHSKPTDLSLVLKPMGWKTRYFEE